MQEILDLLRSSLRGMWAYRWLGLVASVIVGVGGTATVALIPDQYEAAARVHVDTQSILKPLMSGLTVQPNVEQQVAIVARTLLSRPNIERVVRMADLDHSVESPQQRDALIDSLIKNIKFSMAGGPNLYLIGYRADDPDHARRIVQSLLTIFVESNLGGSRRDADQARKFIDDQIKVYEQRLIESENALKEFKIRHIIQMPNVGGDSIARSGDLQGQLQRAKMELAEAQYSRDELRKQLSIEPQLIPDDRLLPDAVGGIGGNAARRTEYDDRISLQRKRLDELTLRFTEQHPDVIGTKRVIEQLEAARDAELKAETARVDAAAAASPAAPKRTPGMAQNPVYQQLRVSLAESEAKVASLQARTRELESRIAQMRVTATYYPKLEVELKQLDRNYEVTKRNYDQLVARRESAQLSGQMEATTGVADFRVVDPPRVSPQPVYPNRNMLMTGVLFLSIAAGLGIAFLRDQIRPTFLDMRSLRYTTGLPILGAVSLLEDGASVSRARRGNIAFTATTATYLGVFIVFLAWAWLRQLVK